MRKADAMTMKGFDPKWKDIPDYIIGITREIWEDRGIGSLNHYYTPEMIKRSPAGVVVGSRDVISETMQSIAAVPDMQIYAEDVIWSGDDTTGFLSSHRVFNVSTHANDGIYGPATGKQVVQKVIADCACLNDAIYDEWLVFDQGAVTRQLGQHPRDFARWLIEMQGGSDKASRPFTPAMDIAGPYKGRGNDSEWGARYVDLLGQVMAADFAALPKIYDRAVLQDLPGGAVGRGVGDADRFWLSLRASFPTATLDIQHVIGRHDPMLSPRAAVRWALSGKHDGWGMFGAPTGADVYVWGFSHAEFGPWGLRRECVLFDEVQIWKQIHLHTGNV
jgi:predicted ester cyclase